MQKYGV